MDVVRADDLQPELPGEPQEPGDDLALLGDAMVLDFDEIILASEDVDEPRGRLVGVVPAVVQQVLGHQRRQAPRESDEAPRMPGKRLKVRPWLVIEPLQMGVAHKLQKVLVALDVPGEEPQVEDAPALVAAALLFEPRALGKVKLAADQRLDPLALRRGVEVNGPK